MIFSILIAVLIFCAIITIHEFGHFIAARACKISVKEFAIGMGPAIFKHQGKNTLFALRILPIGGYCDMSEDTDGQTDPDHFRNKPVWKRFIAICAGAVMNLLLGFILCMVMVAVDGSFGTTTVAFLSDNPVAENYGFIPGDKILKINGRHMYSSRDIMYILSTDEDGIVSMELKRGTENIKLPKVVFNIDIDPETGARVLNYDFKVLGEKVSISNIIPFTIAEFNYMARIVFYSLIDLISGKYGLNDLSGPVGIVSAISDYTVDFGIDWNFLLEIAALISINVGIFNLLPLPALDGGRLVFLIAEAIRKKPIKAEVEGSFHFIGFALLMVLMVVVTFNDVLKIFK
ncbi:MAG: RIP metalloprotease RseP [Ruminococcus sp.]|jgi:regulator of sigma E protease|nr:RIP metalloprotease RseP [Ruminococcus sp.]